MLIQIRNIFSSKRSANQERGANFVEMALMLPIALFVLYALIYYCFTLIVEGTAEYTIHNALQSAIVAPEIENIPVPIPGDCFEREITCQNDADPNDEDNFCCALSVMKQNIITQLGERFIAPGESSKHFAYLKAAAGQSDAVRIIIPQDNEKGISAADNPQEALREVPIKFEVDFAVAPIFYGLPPLQRTVRTAGFYEVQSSLSYPVPIDCMGNAYGSADYNYEGCNCAESNGRILNGSCKACSWGSIPYLEGHSSLGSAPEGYEGTHFGCWCPSSSTCKEKLNNSAGAIKWKSGTGCGCQCSWYLTFRGDGNGGCRCNNSLGDYNYTERESHPGFTQWLGQPPNDLSMNPTQNVNGKCTCEVGEEVSVTYPVDYSNASLAGQTITAPAGSTFSQTHCDYLWGPGVTKLQTQGGCECGCPQKACPTGQYYFSDSGGGVCAGSCKCWKSTSGSIVPNPKEIWDGTSCVCDPSRSDVPECEASSDCGGDPNACAHKKYEADTCKCVCDEDFACGDNAFVADDCRCTCTYNPLIPYAPGACPGPDDGNGTG